MGREVRSGANGERLHRVVVLDLGVKYNIMRSLRRLGCDVMAVPAKTSAEDILALHPEGVVLSPGPGRPSRRKLPRLASSGSGGSSTPRSTLAPARTLSSSIVTGARPGPSTVRV